MCVGLAALPAIGMITSLIGTGVSAAGAYAGAQAEADAASFQQKQETMLAEDALKRGAEAEAKQRRETSALQGRQRAVLAASNLDIGSGSPLAILGDTAQLGELDALTVRNNSEREASYHRTNASFAGMKKKSAKSAGMWAVAGTLAGGASALAEKWYKPAKTGAA